MSAQDQIQEDFYTERTRILAALASEENQHVVMRLVGALAFRTHCPKFGYIQDALGREFTDIDFASYRSFFKDIVRILTGLGYEEDKMVTRLFSDRRLLFHDPVYGRHIDVFFNKLEFSHVLPLEGRLEADTVTLPLAELLLEKMQIYELNEKDLIDTIMLVREHPIGDSDDEEINATVICGLLAHDWGFWRTVTKNIDLVDHFLDRYEQLSADDRKVVRERLTELRSKIDSTPKSMGWKVRAKLGDRVKWYKDVEELADR